MALSNELIKFEFNLSFLGTAVMRCIQAGNLQITMSLPFVIYFNISFNGRPMKQKTYLGQCLI